MFIIIIILIVAAFIYIPYATSKARKERIYEKYGHTEIADRIVNRTIWVGETREQLLDSWGSPLDIDEKVLKTKRKEIWKYFRKSANRYGYKITVEDGIVVGWDEKM